MNTAAISGLAADLFPGETGHFVCPNCDGGTSHERSFNVTRRPDGSLAFMCHRASCGFKGVTGGNLFTPTRDKGPPRKSSHKPFKAALGPLSQASKDLVLLKYGITEKTLREFGVDEAEGGMLHMPVYGYLKSCIKGNVLRTVGKSPKRVLSYKCDGVINLLAYYSHAGNGPAFLVEGQLDAMKIWQCGYSAIALCGTYLDLSRVLEICQKYGRAALFLDYDAAAKAARYVQEYSPYFESLTMILEYQDPKDIPEQELTEKLQRHGDFINARIENHSRHDSEQRDVAEDTQTCKEVSEQPNPSDTGLY